MTTPLESFKWKDLCWSCQSEVGVGFFCHHCSKLQPLSGKYDYFGLFQIPQKLLVDESELTRRFYELSRKFHPDYYQERSEADQKMSLEISSAINQAYQTLKDPLKRAEYVLMSNGVLVKDQKVTHQFPPHLKAVIFEVQEKVFNFDEAKAGLDDARLKKIETALKEAHRTLSESQHSLPERLHQLFQAWDADPKREYLEKMLDLLNEANYLRSTIREIEKRIQPS